MEDIYGRLGEILRPQNKEQVKQLLDEQPDSNIVERWNKLNINLLNEAERNGDDIIVKKIVDDIFELDDYTLLPSDKIPVMKTIIYDTDDPLVKAIKSEIQQTKDNG